MRRKYRKSPRPPHGASEYQLRLEWRGECRLEKRSRNVSLSQRFRGMSHERHGRAQRERSKYARSCAGAAAVGHHRPQRRMPSPRGRLTKLRISATMIEPSYSLAASRVSDAPSASEPLFRQNRPPARRDPNAHHRSAPPGINEAIRRKT